MKTFVLYRNTKDRCANEQEENVISKMNDEAIQIAFGTFTKHCDWKEVAANLGYDQGFTLSGDPHVTYLKSRYGGLPCYILGHSECDFIFLRPDDAKMLQEVYTKGISAADWERCTKYGKGAVDVRS